MNHKDKVHELKEYLRIHNFSRAEFGKKIGYEGYQITHLIKKDIDSKKRRDFWDKASKEMGIDFYSESTIKRKVELPEYIIHLLRWHGNAVIEASLIDKYSEANIISYIKDKFNIDCMLRSKEDTDGRTYILDKV